jgi:hypothetical protein
MVNIKLIKTMVFTSEALLVGEAWLNSERSVFLGFGPSETWLLLWDGRVWPRILSL